MEENTKVITEAEAKDLILALKMIRNLHVQKLKIFQ